MDDQASKPERGSDTSGRSLELLNALNAAAVSLQQSVRSESEIFRVFSEQVSALGLRGGLSLLDGTGQNLIVQAIAQPRAFVKLLTRIERIVKLQHIGYSISLASVPAYRQVVETSKAVFVADSSDVILQLVPTAARRFAKHIIRVFGNSPVIYAPLLSDARVIGVLNIAGKNLLSTDVPAVEAFANHIAVALTNARLITTLRQIAEERLKFSLGMERSTDAIFLTQPDGVITYVNPAFEKLYGYSKTEAVGQTPRLLKSGVMSLHDYEQFWQTLLARQVVTHEIVNKTKDGCLITVEESVSPIIDEAGALTGFLAIQRDITERKHAEQQLRRSEEQYRLLFENNPHPMWVYDCETLKFLAVNEAAIHHYGYSREEFLAMTIKDIRPPDDVAALLAFTVAHRHNSLTEAGIWQHRKKDGSLIHVEITTHFLEFDRRSAKIVLANDVTQRLRAEEQVRETHAELVQAYKTTLEGWVRALDLRDKETEGHTQRVTDLALHLAHTMGIKEDDLVHIRHGALLHDIGKMGVPDAILLKPGPLTDSEWEIMRKHPEYAYELLAPIHYLRPALDIPYCHHEKWDGTGYPRQLRGEQIPLSARIFAIVDVWDALNSDRPYRRAWERERVIEHIHAQTGKHFDPRVVAEFLKIVL